jgi:hypothetical protein
MDSGAAAGTPVAIRMSIAEMKAAARRSKKKEKTDDLPDELAAFSGLSLNASSVSLTSVCLSLRSYNFLLFVFRKRFSSPED